MQERFKNILLFTFYALFLGALFAGVYGTTNHLGELSETTYKVYWDWELGIPFVPQMIFVYFSLNLLTAFGLFYFSKNDIHAVAGAYAFAIVGAGIVFVTFPTTLGFSRQGQFTEYADFFNTLYALDLPHNLFPSLHVTFAGIAVFTVYGKASDVMKKVLLVWLVSIFAAVILTHQHHLLDILGGLILAGISVNIVFFPLVQRLER